MSNHGFNGFLNGLPRIVLVVPGYLVASSK